MKKLEVPSRNILQKLYIEENLSMSSIATIFNTSTMTVRSWLNSRKIKTRVSNISVYHELRNCSFNDTQKDLIIGSLLGDGGLRIPKRGKNAHFYERHCEKQRMYLEWKKNLLKPFVQRTLDKESGGDHTISGIDCVVQDSYKMITIAHPYLTTLWNEFYVGNGNKVLPKNVESYLNHFVLAVWVCDDGSLTWKHRYYKLDLHTENFTYEDNLRIKMILSKYFDGNISIYNRKYKNGIRQYISMTGKEELKSLCNRMISLVPDCMKYKFNTHI